MPEGRPDLYQMGPMNRMFSGAPGEMSQGLPPEILALLKILAQSSGPTADALARGSTLQRGSGGLHEQTVLNRIRETRGSTPSRAEIDAMLQQILRQAQKSPDPGMMPPSTVGEARNWDPEGG
jgi:hypothetical protein